MKARTSPGFQLKTQPPIKTIVSSFLGDNSRGQSQTTYLTISPELEPNQKGLKKIARC